MMLARGAMLKSTTTTQGIQSGYLKFNVGSERWYKVAQSNNGDKVCEPLSQETKGLLEDVRSVQQAGEAVKIE